MKGGAIGILLLVFVGVLGFGASLVFFTVPESHQALIIRVGEVRAVVTEPGLKMKIPFIENVVYLEKRNLELDQNPVEIVASDQERLVVDAYARFRITDPERFYESVNNETNARQRLSTILDRSLRQTLGEVNREAIISGQRAELMLQIRDLVKTAAAGLGIEILDVKIRRADLPDENSQAVYDRMRTDREQQAAQIRAEGEEEARTIRAQADREVVEILAEAQEQAQRMRGDADAERNRIFADAYNRDMEFFAFYRSLLAYEQSLQSGETTIVLSPNSEFFRYFSNISGRPPEGDRAN